MIMNRVSNTSSGDGGGYSHGGENPKYHLCFVIFCGR